jgi:hypothetical protein
MAELSMTALTDAVNGQFLSTLAQLSVRHEALLFRMEVKDRPSPRHRSGGVKLRAA